MDVSTGTAVDVSVGSGVSVGTVVSVGKGRGLGVAVSTVCPGRHAVKSILKIESTETRVNFARNTAFSLMMKELFYYEKWRRGRFLDFIRTSYNN
jgi:hypothetical protein